MQFGPTSWAHSARYEKLPRVSGIWVVDIPLLYQKHPTVMICYPYGPLKIVLYTIEMPFGPTSWARGAR